MISKPSRLAFLGMVLACAVILIACSDSTPRLQFVTVAPISGEIYVSAAPVGAVRGAAHRGARPALHAPPPTGRHSAQTVQPVTATCGSLQYAATALFSDGSTKDVSSTATWSSSNSTVASVSSTGLATGIALGTTNISATFTGISSTTEPLGVDQLNSITLSPTGTVAVPLGSTQSFLAIGNFTFAAGGSGNLDVSSQVTWNSSNMAVATIDTSGNATAVGMGTSTISATSCDGITVGTATLTVGAAAATSLVITPATITISTGTTTLFTAMEMFSDGSTHPLSNPVTWASGTTTVATIDPNSAVALGVTAGTSTITATEMTTGFTGTATLTVQAATARYAFIGNIQGNATGTPLGSGSISGYSVDLTVNPPLTQMTGSPFGASSPQQLLIHPSGRLMFYPDASSSLLTNLIDPSTGTMTPSGRIPSTAGSGGANVGVIDPLGRFIYILDDGNFNPPTTVPTIYGFSIAQTNTQSTNGVLTGITGAAPYTDATLNIPTWIMTDRAGLYLYVVNSGNNTISEYSITQSGASAGALTPIGTIATGSAPFIGTTDVNGHVFVANSGDNTVSVFSIGSSGVLAQVGTTNFGVTGATSVANVLTDPTGKYLYVLDSPGGTTPPPGQVFAYNLNSTSTTNVIGMQIGTPQPTGTGPIGMAIDPTGALLAIDNNIGQTISLFTVGSNGGVTPTSPIASVPTDLIPQFVVFYTAASDQ